MKKRVFIAHGWDGYPREGWFPWLKKELETKGFEVFVPQLPEAGSPRIHNWVPKLAEVVGTADENTYFVGHSMGCQTIARYLETLPEGVQVGMGAEQQKIILEVTDEVKQKVVKRKYGFATIFINISEYIKPWLDI